MRGLVCLAAIGSVLATAHWTKADDAQDVKALVDKVFKAGGLEKLERPRGYSFKVTLTTKIAGKPDAVSTEVHYFQPPKNLRFEIEVPKAGGAEKSVQVIAGDKGWLLKDGEVQALDSRTVEVGDFDVKSFGFLRLLDLKNKDYSASALGKSKVGDRDVDGIRLTRTLGRTVVRDKFFFDAQTHLLIKSEGQAGRPRPESEILWEDYRTIDGVAVPHRVVYTIKGSRPVTYVRTYSDVKFVDKLDPHLFDKP